MLGVVARSTPKIENSFVNVEILSTISAGTPAKSSSLKCSSAKSSIWYSLNFSKFNARTAFLITSTVSFWYS